MADADRSCAELQYRPVECQSRATSRPFSKTMEPDLVAVQECPSRQWKIPDNWHVQRAGELIVVSRYPISHEKFRIAAGRRANPVINGLYCVVETPSGPVGVCSVHLETPRRGLSTVLDREKVIDLEQTDYAKNKSNAES